MTDQRSSSILVINCGSSSLKFSLYETVSLFCKWSGSISHIGSGHGKMEIKTNQQQVLESKSVKSKNMEDAVKDVIIWLKSKYDQKSLSAISHRLVQGGPDHRQPELITEQLMETLHQFDYLAPNHLPDELTTIKTFQRAFPDIPQVACFDTAFHKDMPPHAKDYPLPEKYKEMGLMKYGFHGLSYQYILQELTSEDPEIIKKKIIIAHLGNGASMVAVKDGISVDTTMGVSPTGGLVMGTRRGDLDPGVLLFLLKRDQLTPNQLDELLSKDAGLKAISGISDVQALLKTESNDAKAAEALTIFCYAAKKFIGALAAAMGGLGENSDVIRKRICKDLEFMGIDLADSKSRVAVRVIPTNEELMIARLTGVLLNDKNK